MSPQATDGGGRAKQGVSLPVALVDVFAALPAAGSLPNGTRAYASDKALELIAVNGVWQPAAGGLLPVGAVLPYVGDTDPGNIGGGITFLLADGRLIDRTTYAAFFARAAHKYNGGVDPGSNMVRIPDKRGRVSVGADNMGTVQGAASRLPNSSRAAGQNGGEERHTQTSGEIPAHTHALTITTFQPRADSGNTGVGASAQYVAGSNGFTGLGAATPPTGSSVASAGSGTPFNVMQPYEVDNVIVRVA